jgi:hypothetical protein
MGSASRGWGGGAVSAHADAACGCAHASSCSAARACWSCMSYSVQGARCARDAPPAAGALAAASASEQRAAPAARLRSDSPRQGACCTPPQRLLRSRASAALAAALVRAAAPHLESLGACRQRGARASSGAAALAPSARAGSDTRPDMQGTVMAVAPPHAARPQREGGRAVRRCAHHHRDRAILLRASLSRWLPRARVCAPAPADQRLPCRHTRAKTCSASPLSWRQRIGLAALAPHVSAGCSGRCESGWRPHAVHVTAGAA